MRLICLIALLAILGCGPGDRVEITDTVPRSEYGEAAMLNATSEERFALALPQQHDHADHAAALHFQAPEGWIQVQSTQFREPNFVVGVGGEAQCYVSRLPGGGGGLFANANRWRAQMSIPPYSQDAFDNLPTVDLLGQNALALDFEGAFSGMGQAAPQEGYRLLGVLLETDAEAVFVKMVGPKDIVAMERDRFFAFTASLHQAQGAHTHDVAAQDASQQTDAPGTEPAAEGEIEEAAGTQAADSDTQAGDGIFRWTKPEDWREFPHPSQMRTVTFHMEQERLAECYVTVLKGDGGGMLSNLNRWLAQMGAPPLGETELELQPPTPFLGEAVPLLIAPGTYTDMRGRQFEDYLLLGVAGTTEDKAVFIKLVGPREIVERNWGNFVAFCGSFEEN